MTTSSLWLVFLSHSYIIDNPAFSNILPELFPETCKKLLRVQYTLCILYCSHMLITKCTCTCNSRLMVLQCMGYVPREGCMYFFGRSPRNYIQHKNTTIPCTVKTMRQLTCTDRPYKATARLASAPEYSMYCTLVVQCRVPYARRCSYSSIA